MNRRRFDWVSEQILRPSEIREAAAALLPRLKSAGVGNSARFEVPGGAPPYLRYALRRAFARLGANVSVSVDRTSKPINVTAKNPEGNPTAFYVTRSVSDHAYEAAAFLFPKLKLAGAGKGIHFGIAEGAPKGLDSSLRRAFAGLGARVEVIADPNSKDEKGNPTAFYVAPEQRRTVEKYISRFWSKVHKTPSCWFWKAGQRGSGYGGFSLPGRPPIRVSAHILAWQLKNGPLPKQMTLDHLCGNTRCVNPEHLEAVTRSENTKRQSDWTHAAWLAQQAPDLPVTLKARDIP